MTRLAMALMLAGCGSSQQPGAEFCRSYELNYLTDCQQYCENESGVAADEAMVSGCEQKCAADLAKDDTFEDSCPAQAEKLRAAK